MLDEPTESVAQWLDEKCRAGSLSLREVATRAGLSHSTVANIKNGAQPSAETLKKLARAFSGDGHERMALEDHLFILAGYRSPRPREPNQALGELVDKLSQFSASQLKVMKHFADFISSLEKK